MSELLGSRASDVDTGDTTDIAITRTDPANGVWQFSTDSGHTWQDAGTVSESSALAIGPNDFIRFAPDQKNAGNATFEFRAWNPKNDPTGGRVDATQSGGATRFSEQAGLSTISISAVNDAPVLGAGSQNPAPVMNPQQATGPAR